MDLDLLFADLGTKLASAGWKVDPSDREPDYRSFVRRAGDVYFQIDVAISSSGADSFVGVQHPETSRLVGRFHGRAARSEASAAACSVGFSLSDLVRQAGHSDADWRWRGTEPGDISGLVESLCRDLFEYGVPHLHRLSSLAAIVEHLDADSRRHQMLDGHLAVAAALLGSNDTALLALTSYAEKARTQAGLVAQQSKRFIKAYVEHFKLGETLSPSYRAS